MTLREIRKSMGLTMKQVAQYANVSEALISLIETGKRRPAVRVAKRLGKLYGLPLEAFYRGVD